MPWTQTSDVGPLFVAAVGITLVSLTDTIATATSFAARRGEEVDPNQEMIGIGAANVAAGLFQGFSISTSGSRTAVAEQSGAKSQLTGVVGAGLVAVLLLFLNSLLADLPQTALAAVVITAALSLMDLGALRRYWRVRKSALRALARRHRRCRCSSACSQGIVIAIVLSILMFFQRSWWPHGAVLGQVDGDGWHGIDQPARSPSSSRASSCSAGSRRSSSPTPARSAGSSASSSATATRRGSSCSAKRSPTSTSPPPACSRTSTTSSTTQGVHLAFAEMRDRLQDLTLRYGLFDTLDRDHFYPTLDAALAAIEEINRCVPRRTAMSWSRVACVAARSWP